jgi:tRNA(Ile)-lysidine synthase TilS/MesJ
VKVKTEANVQIWRDLYCVECKTIQGFTRLDIIGWKHYFCNECDKFTEMQFTGDKYARTDSMERIEAVLPFETEQN